MKTAVLLNVHNDVPLIKDTIQSIKKYITEDILVIVDSAFWKEIENIDLTVPKMEGLYHKSNKSPYRNVALGLKTLYETYHNYDWYCYIEYDCLVVSDYIKTTLEIAKSRNIWFLGNDGKISPGIQIPYLETLLNMEISQSAYYYSLGCCQFFSHRFLETLNDRKFFDNFLNLTNYFNHGFYPYYTGYDVSEHLYPTLARLLGGKIAILASRDYKNGTWHGNYKHYPMRWLPEISHEEFYPEASILHPIKSYDHPLREYYRKVRSETVNIRNNS